MQRALEKGVTLPRYVVIKSDNGQWLNYTKEKGKFQGCLKFSDTNPYTPYNPCTKFEIEPSKTSSSFVNIKSSYNNKYWALLNSSTNWIGAVGDQPNEAQSSRTCTLFEPFYSQDTNLLKLRHVNLNKYVYSWADSSSEYYGYLYANDPINPDANPCNKIEDWESIMILPKFVVFKGDNGKYLRATKFNGENFLQFSGTDIGDSSVMHEVIYFPGGDYFQLKSVGVGKLWRLCLEGWLLADAGNYVACEHFVAKKINDNTLALRANGCDFRIFLPGNFLFCQRLTRDGVSDCLNANTSSMIKETYLMVMEPVISRSVYDVIFDLLNSKVYNQHVLTMATGVATNESNQPTTVTLKLAYTNTTSNRWDCSLSLKLGVQLSLKAGIPLLYDGGIKVSAEFTGSYSWGKTIESTETMETSYQVTVAPMTKVKVSLVATQGQCDIPFSYVKRDTLYNGDTVTEALEDGIYSGVNYYNFNYVNEESPLY